MSIPIPRMRYRALGKTGITVSEIGFGGLGIGGVSADVASYGPSDDRESLRALGRAYDLGVTFYDTSPDYGQGHSEELIGQAFRGRRNSVVIASKVGFVSLARPNDEAAIRKSLEPANIRQTLAGTLRRLGSGYLDLLQVHSPPAGLLKRHPEVISSLEDLKRGGQIRAWGISLKSPADGEEAIALGAAAIQVNFSLIDQRALDTGLLDLARNREVGLIVRTPFNYGFLTGRYSGSALGPEDHRTRFSPQRRRQWAEAPALFAGLNRGRDRSMTELALQFCLAPSGVSAVIPGMQRVREVEENIRPMYVPPLDSAEFEAIREIYRSSAFSA